MTAATNRSPEELARLKAIRERFQRDKPTAEELVTSGEYRMIHVPTRPVVCDVCSRPMRPDERFYGRQMWNALEYCCRHHTHYACPECYRDKKHHAIYGCPECGCKVVYT